jgi:hypothetical protein
MTTTTTTTTTVMMSKDAFAADLPNTFAAQLVLRRHSQVQRRERQRRRRPRPTVHVSS